MTSTCTHISGDCPGHHTPSASATASPSVTATASVTASPSTTIVPSTTVTATTTPAPGTLPVTGPGDMGMGAIGFGMITIGTLAILGVRHSNRAAERAERAANKYIPRHAAWLAA